jgi:hypothetical protein
MNSLFFNQFTTKQGVSTCFVNPSNALIFTVFVFFEKKIDDTSKTYIYEKGVEYIEIDIGYCAPGNAFYVASD